MWHNCSCIANNKEIEIEDGVLKKYLDNTISLNAEERGRILEADAAFTDCHQELALEGQTASNPDEQVNHHFIGLIHKDGKLWEMDGRKTAPVSHGPTTEENLLQDAAKVCKSFMSRDPDEVRFTVIALTPTQE